MPSELAALENVQRPTATRTIKCLEAEGLIKRTPDPLDGRSALVSVTTGARPPAPSATAQEPLPRAPDARPSAAQLRTLDEAAEILESLLLEQPARAVARGGEAA